MFQYAGKIFPDKPDRGVGTQLHSAVSFYNAVVNNYR